MRQDPTATFDDARMERIMGRLLQVGVLASATVVLAGGIRYLLTHAGEQADYRSFVPHALQLRHPAVLLYGIAHADAASIIQLGILMLIATPIARVVFAFLAFIAERDRLYIAISAVVLAVLLFGMLRTS